MINNEKEAHEAREVLDLLNRVSTRLFGSDPNYLPLRGLVRKYEEDIRQWDGSQKAPQVVQYDEEAPPKPPQMKLTIMFDESNKSFMVVERHNPRFGLVQCINRWRVTCSNQIGSNVFVDPHTKLILIGFPDTSKWRRMPLEVWKNRRIPSDEINRQIFNEVCMALREYMEIKSENPQYNSGSALIAQTGAPCWLLGDTHIGQLSSPLRQVKEKIHLEVSADAEKHTITLHAFSTPINSNITLSGWKVQLRSLHNHFRPKGWRINSSNRTIYINAVFNSTSPRTCSVRSVDFFSIINVLKELVSLCGDSTSSVGILGEKTSSSLEVVSTATARFLRSFHGCAFTLPPIGPRWGDSEEGAFLEYVQCELLEMSARIDSIHRTFAKKEPYLEMMARIRKQRPRAYESWSAEEDNALCELRSVGYSIPQLCDLHQRTSGGIFSRLSKLGKEL